MKLLLIGSMLFTGGSAVAMQNETVNEEVTQAYNQTKVMFQKGFRGNMLETVKETGYPYPNEAMLENLTEEQQVALLTAVDQINATYNWATMSDEEILDALQAIKADMELLHEELGIEALQSRTQTRARKGRKYNDNFVPNGNYQQDGSCIDDEVTDGDTV